MGDSFDLFGKISQLAGRQWGHVTRAQLISLGMGSTTIADWVQRGWLVPVHAGVYAVGYRRTEVLARAYAAVLACGPTAALSHESALALWGLRRWPRRIEVTLTSGDRRPSGLWVHRSRTLSRVQLTVEYGIRTTRAARAIQDMGRRLTREQRIRLVNRARLDHKLTAEEAERLLHHRRNPTRSGLEDAFQRWIERSELPQPEINVAPGGREVDAIYPRQRLIIELDDYATHGDSATFQSDRDRDLQHLDDLDHTTVRLTRERLTADTAERVRRILSRRAAAPRPAPDPRAC